MIGVFLFSDCLTPEQIAVAEIGAIADPVDLAGVTD